MYKVKIFSGFNKDNSKENYDVITLNSGSITAVVGNTGSGKSRLIKDIEQTVNKNSVSKRIVTIEENGTLINSEDNLNIVAHLGQNMRFMLDTTVKEFIELHCECRGKICDINDIISLTNDIAKEPISENMNLNLLSGGQTRALMIADIALICDSPIVLIDEIENAGIDKIKALDILTDNKKLILVVTHDPHTALMADKRIVMKNGGVSNIVQRTESELSLFEQMDKDYKLQMKRQSLLRKGETIL